MLISMTEGELLRQLVDKSGFTVTQVAEKCGISRPQLYILFKEKTIGIEWKEKLKAVGIVLQKEEKSYTSKESGDFGKMEKDLDVLSRLVFLQEELIKGHSRKMSELEERVKVLESKLKTTKV